MEFDFSGDSGLNELDLRAGRGVSFTEPAGTIDHCGFAEKMSFSCDALELLAAEPEPELELELEFVPVLVPVLEIPVPEELELEEAEVT